MITQAMLYNLSRLEPFGVGNPAPLFLLRDCEISNIKLCGAASQHMFFDVSVGGRFFKGKMWNSGELYEDFFATPNRDLVFHLTEPFANRIDPELEVVCA